VWYSPVLPPVAACELAYANGRLSVRACQASAHGTATTEHLLLTMPLWCVRPSDDRTYRTHLAPCRFVPLCANDDDEVEFVSFVTKFVFACDLPSATALRAFVSRCVSRLA